MFIRRVIQSRCVWGLKSDSGWPFAWSIQMEEQKILPFWSDRELARRCARDEWAEYEPSPIKLDDFMQRWLPGMAEEGTFAGTNWSADLIGTEIDPSILFEELEEAAKTQQSSNIRSKRQQSGKQRTDRPGTLDRQAKKSRRQSSSQANRKKRFEASGKRITSEKKDKRVRQDRKSMRKNDSSQ